MLILGIDPGTATTGFGILKVKSDSDFEVVDFGLIETEKNTNTAERLLQIHLKISKIIASYNPDVLAMEKIFFATNAKTVIQVGQAQGVMLFAAAQNSIDVFEYAPGTIKKLISGNGKSDKKQMQKALRNLFGAKIRSRPHKKTHFDNAVDALAIALTHALRLRENGAESIQEKKCINNQEKKARQK
ncbi:MAG: crossover junction endodeoxyribonuclease RuvC [Patescibacteria group bacterium]|nr:crossover junction endodeoxyribonuclease RuvC [Patescibacteria group bacterium]